MKPDLLHRYQEGRKQQLALLATLKEGDVVAIEQGHQFFIATTVRRKTEDLIETETEQQFALRDGSLIPGSKDQYITLTCRLLPMTDTIRQSIEHRHLVEMILTLHKEDWERLCLPTLREIANQIEKELY